MSKTISLYIFNLKEPLKEFASMLSNLEIAHTIKYPWIIIKEDDLNLLMLASGCDFTATYYGSDNKLYYTVE